MRESVYTVPRQRVLALLEDQRPFERVIFAFFVYLALLAWLRGLAWMPRVGLTALPVMLFFGWRGAGAIERPWAWVTREWAALSLILAAYWSVELFAGPTHATWPAAWVQWDRRLLTDYGLRPVIEAGGPLLPTVLEGAYLLLYSLPPLALGLIYLSGTRAGRERFLQVLFLATLTTYALLPLLPVASPRMAFPGLDQPHYSSLPRQINVWVADHLDITVGVFPSGHVTVGFACAFGLFAARPRRRLLPWTMLAAAALVALATLYGRYHYTVDVVAGLAVAASAHAAVAWWNGTE